MLKLVILKSGKAFALLNYGIYTPNLNRQGYVLINTVNMDADYFHGLQFFINNGFLSRYALEF